MRKTLDKVDIKYHVDYNENGFTDCAYHGCNDEGICRCYTIESPYIESIDYRSVAEKIYAEMFADTRKAKLSDLLYGGVSIDIYCITRLLSSYKAIDYVEFEWRGGYYGDEMDKVYINSSELEYNINLCVSMQTLTEKLNFCLLKEYKRYDRHINDETEYEMITITQNDIDMLNINKNHMNNIKSDPMWFHSLKKYGSDIPRGIVRQTEVGYHIIDGYHRIFALDKNDKFTVFKIKNK